MTDEEIDRLANTATDQLLTIGMEAQIAAMKALVAVAKSAETSDERVNMAIMAGAIAFTQFKLEATVAAIVEVNPEFAELIKGCREVAHDAFGPSFRKNALNSAVDFGLSVRSSD